MRCGTMGGMNTYAIHYGGSGHGWFVIRRRAEHDYWQTYAGPYTSRSQAEHVRDEENARALRAA